MRTSSLCAVTSPVTSMIRVEGEVVRTSKVVAWSGIGAPSDDAEGTVFVVGDGHEVRESRDLEDPAVVLREAKRAYGDPALACLGEDPHDERDPGAVDVV